MKLLDVFGLPIQLGQAERQRPLNRRGSTGDLRNPLLRDRHRGAYNLPEGSAGQIGLAELRDSERQRRNGIANSRRPEKVLHSERALEGTILALKR